MSFGGTFGPYEYNTKVDWVIVGGESGPGARPFNLAWAESLQQQCKAAGVAFFMKQVGSVPMMSDELWRTAPTMNTRKLLIREIALQRSETR